MPAPFGFGWVAEDDPQVAADAAAQAAAYRMRRQVTGPAFGALGPTPLQRGAQAVGEGLAGIPGRVLDRARTFTEGAMNMPLGASVSDYPDVVDAGTETAMNLVGTPGGAGGLGSGARLMRSAAPSVDHAVELSQLERAAQKNVADRMAASQEGQDFVGLPGGPPGIRAYHGSPHDFDKFSMEKIGTGEGAQVYGHGLYFAEHEPVATEYRDKLRLGYIDNDKMHDPKILGSLVYDIAKEHGIDVGGKVPWGPTRGLASKEDIIKSYENGSASPHDLSPFYRSEIAKRLAPPGHMYEVEIKADPSAFIDYDTPLFKQAEIGEKVRDIADKIIGPNNIYNSSMGLKGAHGLIQNPEFAKAAREAGIHGIKYADQGSRGMLDGRGLVRNHQTGDWIVQSTGQSFKTLPEANAAMQKAISRNYVVFDDKMIDILRKYGIPGMLAAGAGADELGLDEKQ